MLQTARAQSCKQPSNLLLRVSDCIYRLAVGQVQLYVRSQVHALSPDGRCKAFDAAANGYGRGEGYAVAVLEPAEFAAHALAVFRGSAVNQDGRCARMWNKPSVTSHSTALR